MIRESAPTVPGDDMGTANSSETARIEALLSRLEPDDGGTCRVAGCLHPRRAGGPGGPPALAA